MGRSPKKIDSSWGKQRVKGLSIIEILKDAFCKVFKINNKHKETSLIEQYYYPKYGPGQMYEEMAKKIEKMGGTILKEHEVIKINNTRNRIKSITCQNKGKKIKLQADYLISSMPIKDLISGMDNVPKNIYSIATTLPYRDFVTVGLVVDKLKIENNTKMKTLNNIVPDCWIYIQSSEVKLGRIQIFNNWSPYLVKDIDNTVSLGLEFFCFENDEFWNSKDKDLVAFAKKELVEIGVIDKETKVRDYHIERVQKAYPAYFDSYKDFDKVKNYLNEYDNLYCIGRNGQHRYNNMDHSMLCGIICAENIMNNIKSKDNIWNVNTEESYHEEKK